MSNKEYIDTAEAARMIRVLLKRHFPGQKFYVNIDRFSGGSSIDVEWMDGPTQADVNEVIGGFDGKGFDGMIDLAYSNSSWLMPDGEVVIASCQGTEGSRGSVPSWETRKPHPDAKRVQFTAWLNVERVYSPEFVERVVSKVAEENGWDMPKIQTGHWWAGKKERGTQAWVDTNLELWMMHHYIDALKATSLYQNPESPKADNKGNESNGTESGKVEIRYEGSWTWIKFPSKPPLSVRTAIKDLGARWGHKRQAWYIREVVEARDVLNTIANA